MGRWSQSKRRGGAQGQIHLGTPVSVVLSYDNGLQRFLTVVTSQEIPDRVTVWLLKSPYTGGQISPTTFPGSPAVSVNINVNVDANNYRAYAQLFYGPYVSQPIVSNTVNAS